MKDISIILPATNFNASNLLHAQSGNICDRDCMRGLGSACLPCLRNDIACCHLDQLYVLHTGILTKPPILQ